MDEKEKTNKKKDNKTHTIIVRLNDELFNELDKFASENMLKGRGRTSKAIRMMIRDVSCQLQIGL